jgi:hypothetical protein
MRDRVEELTLRFADGLATESEIDELERLVAADPEAARVHVLLLELEGELRGGRADLDLSAKVLERIRRAREDRIERGVMERVRRSPRRTSSRAARPGPSTPGGTWRRRSARRGCGIPGTCRPTGKDIWSSRPAGSGTSSRAGA